MKLMLAELQLAVELEPNKESLNLLQRAYEDRGMQSSADQIGEELKKCTKKSTTTPKKVKRPRKVVI